MKIAPNPINNELASAKLISVDRLLFDFGVLIIYLYAIERLDLIVNLHDEGAEEHERGDEEDARYSEEVLGVHGWVVFAIPVICQCVQAVDCLIHFFPFIN